MTDSARIASGLQALASLAHDVAANLASLEPIVDAMRRTLAAGGTLFFAGNGGSAADAQHLAAEYVVRYRRGAQLPLRAIALTTDTSILTAAANDFGYEQVFARQIAALARRGDLLVVHSTSGDSANCVAAVEAARLLGVVTVGFLGGSGGALASRVDLPFVIRDDRVNHVQELHLAIQHQIIGILTSEYGG
jgi:D-sedoheptulose 7-phosphate isomerase